jgi:hypothetical protein
MSIRKVAAVSFGVVAVLSGWMPGGGFEAVASPLARSAAAIGVAAGSGDVELVRRRPPYGPWPTPPSIRVVPGYGAYGYSQQGPIQPFAGGPAQHKMGPIGPFRPYRIWIGPDGVLRGE